jgi:hypothetical protein
MIALYLYVNSFLYLIFSIWCLLKFHTTSSFLGYEFINNSGKVEYLTTYTGLQMGFAIFLGTVAHYENFRLHGLIFCVALYAGIVITRIGSSFYFGDLEKATYFVGALELTLCIGGILLLVHELKPYE